MLRTLALAVVVIAAGYVALEVARYEQARAAWSTERERLGSAEYDAARSDAAYVQVEARRASARTGADVLAVALLVAAALAAGATPQDGEPEPPPGRLLAASTLDVALVAVLLASASAIPTVASSLALTDALTRILTAVTVALPLAMLARGASPGMRAAGVRVRPPSPLRAAVAISLLPITAAWLSVALLPLVIAARLRRPLRPAWVAPHLALSGALRAPISSSAGQ